MQPIVGLITCCTWSRITLALETEQDLFEAREVRGIGARTCDSLALRVLKLDDITNTRRISQVYLRGHRVDRENLRANFVRQ